MLKSGNSNAATMVAVLLVAGLYAFYNPQTKKLDFDNPDLNPLKYVDDDYKNPNAKKSNGQNSDGN